MKRKASKPADPVCTFCQTPHSKVDLLVFVDSAEGPSICDHCVGIAVLLVEEFQRKKAKDLRTH